MVRGIRGRGLGVVAAVALFVAAWPGSSHAGDPFAPAADDLGVRRTASIERGRAWLLERQDPSGAFASGPLAGGTPRSSLEIGEHALATWALASVRRDARHDAALQRAVRLLRRVAPRLVAEPPDASPVRTTYAIGATLCALATAELGPRWVERPGPPPRDRALRALARTLVQHLVAHQDRYGGIRYPGAGDDTTRATTDTSNSAYFARALVAARCLGAPSTAEPARRLGMACATWQETDGPPWRRTALAVPGEAVPAASPKAPPDPPDVMDRARGVPYLVRRAVPQDALPHVAPTVFAPRGGPTSSALLIWATALGEGRAAGTLPREDAASFEQCTWDGLAWLDRHFDVAREPGAERPGPWTVAWLADLSFALRQLGIARLGGRDWFAEGAEQLLRLQAPQGWWHAVDVDAGGLRAPLVGRLHDTAFALLFLGLEPTAPAAHALTGMVPLR